MSKLSPLQEEALKLYDMGLNVFPQPYGKRSGTNYRYITLNRPQRSQVIEMFSERQNIAVLLSKHERPWSLFVIQYHQEDDFQTVLATFEQDFGSDLWVVKTKVGGEFWFQSKGRFETVIDEKLPLRFLGNASYVFAPPSVINNFQYSWLNRGGLTPPFISRGYDKLSSVLKYEVPPVGIGFDRTQFKGKSKPGKPTKDWSQGYVNAAEYLPHHPWRDRDGITDFTVTMALLRRFWDVDRSGRGNYQATVRASLLELAEIAHINDKTVERSLQRLQEQNIIEKAGKDKKSGAYKYTFTDDVIEKGESLKPQDEEDTMGVLYSIYRIYLLEKKGLHDLFENDAIDLVKFYLYLTISQNQGITSSQIVQHINISTKTINRYCDVLEKLQLVARDASGKLRATELTDDLAEQIILQTSVLGQSTKRKQENLTKRMRRAGDLILSQLKNK